MKKISVTTQRPTKATIELTSLPQGRVLDGRDVEKLNMEGKALGKFLKAELPSLTLGVLIRELTSSTVC